ncbi:hypothetical protein ACW7N6_38585 [Streptomyces sp. UC1A3]
MSDLYAALGGSTPENNTGEDYARVVDYFGRIAGAMEDGNVRYAWGNIEGLRRALAAFESRISEKTTENGMTARRFTAQGLDPAKVAAASVAFARQYLVGALLHSPDQIVDDEVRAAVLDSEERTRKFLADLG